MSLNPVATASTSGGAASLTGLAMPQSYAQAALAINPHLLTNLPGGAALAMSLASTGSSTAQPVTAQAVGPQSKRGSFANHAQPTRRERTSAMRSHHAAVHWPFRSHLAPPSTKPRPPYPKTYGTSPDRQPSSLASDVAE
ncbi:unnamed protein product [Cyprideis torosa]|uniref:Uncharacterized protein n=1 Tax=Cyprideis torosa TaxID=163714 RepID=A0A7R8ZH30_9CRUS|nr:unnamed protein product [Cyprideis torosa]CAG0882729.1 unnamed protein product [Cyprideis torosa]